MTKLWSKKASEVSKDEYSLIRAEERLVYETQKAIRALMREHEITAAELAALLDVSAARVSQMLGGKATNLTLRTLARIYCVLGSEAAVCEARLLSDAVSAQPSPEPIDDRMTVDIECAISGVNALDAWSDMFGTTAGTIELSPFAGAGSEAMWVLGTLEAPLRDSRGSKSRFSRETSRWLEDVPPPEVITSVYSHV